MKPDFDVAVLGGGMIGAVSALTLRKRGLTVAVLEARPKGREQKVVVGEAITEGTSLYLRHELGLEPWFKANSYRKFGFDFVTLPEHGEALTIEDCNEFMLSQAPLERIPKAYEKLIPTYHVERPALNDHLGELARAAGADWHWGAAIEHVALSEDESPHTVRYQQGGQPMTLTARWVVDCSGRKCLLGRQLGIHHKVSPPNTAAVWNRFENVAADPAIWRSYHGIDRRRHTIHFTGKGFWIWWIHQNDDSTSVGVTWDKDQHQPDVKADDHGFSEMIGKFPVVAKLLAGARAKEPYQLLAHLPYRSDHWISEKRYALLGDAAWFTDALYSIGLETACRQVVSLTKGILDDKAGRACPSSFFAGLNQQFDYCCRAVARMNEFKYKHGWHDPYVLAQTVLYETAEIGPLYQLRDRADWTWDKQREFYGIQWGSQKRLDAIERFLAESLPDGQTPRMPETRLLKKGLLPGPFIYAFTWPLWNVPALNHYFFRMIRTWGHMERLSQRHRLWPDVLSRMAMGRIESAGHLLKSLAAAGRAQKEPLPEAGRRNVGV